MINKNCETRGSPLGRQAELGELAAFCTEPARGPYVWWRAPAWAGKSALMSTFVLHPPPGVVVISFFITARLAAQDTREAFTEVVLEQLAALLGQDLPPSNAGHPATRTCWTCSRKPPHACAQTGRATDPGGGRPRRRPQRHHRPERAQHRRAAARPTRRPGCGSWSPGDPTRPSPTMSRPAPAARPAASCACWPPPTTPRTCEGWRRRELRRLLHGTPPQQDLLGLLTAARGGLSGPDLADLTGLTLWEIEDVLHTVTGRTFTRRVSRWEPQAGPEVYLLGHEELQTSASSYLGEQRLAGYRDRLHTWADTYRDQGWPDRNPRIPAARLLPDAASHRSTCPASSSAPPTPPGTTACSTSPAATPRP